MATQDRVSTDEARRTVAETAVMLASMGLVEGFGHVSVRTDDGFALSSTGPLCAQRADDVLLLDADAVVVREGDPRRCPLEAGMHAAIYRERPDVGAICRTHSPEAARWASRGTEPPLVHGLGGLSGPVTVYGDSDLVTSRSQADAVVAALGDAACVLLQGNGAVCTGIDPAEAITRAWYLEERCAFAAATPDAPPIAGEALSRRARHFAAEQRRAWQWISVRYGPPPDATAQTR